MAPSLRANPNTEFEVMKKKSLDARRHQDKEAWLNIAFYLNMQYVEWVTLRDGSGKLSPSYEDKDLPSEQEMPRPVINKIMHFVNEQLAFATQTKPIADVLPANSDPLQQGDAKVANAYIQYLQEPNVANWEKILFDAYLWALVANEAYIKWTYSETLTRPDIQFCPSTDIYSDPYARDFYKAQWVIHEQFLDPEQVFNVYGVDVEDSAVEKTDVEKAHLLREMGQAPVTEGVVVNELWQLPNRRHPKGRFHVWTGKTTLIDRAPYPYRHGGVPQLPFTQLGVIPRPNSKHYASPVTFLRAPQAELNYYHAQRLMTRKTWALLKLWLPEEITLDEPWNDSPFQVLRGGSVNNATPQIIGPPGAMPDNNDGAWLGEEMGHVIGIRPVSEGQAPGRVEAARALELLREADTSRLATLNSTTGTAIGRGWFQSLMNARQFNREEVFVEAYSKEGVPEVHRFFTNQFKPGMRIRVTQGSGLAFSRAARLDQLNTLWTNGILRDPEAFAQLADIPTPTIISVKQADVQLARNENLTIADGSAVQANSWDDHTIHLREHNIYRKSSDFLSGSDEVKTKFEFHCQQHEKLELEQLKREAEKAALIQATIGPVEGQGPQPGDNSGAGQAPPGIDDETVVQ